MDVITGNLLRNLKYLGRNVQLTGNLPRLMNGCARINWNNFNSNGMNDWNEPNVRRTNKRTVGVVCGKNLFVSVN